MLSDSGYLFSQKKVMRGLPLCEDLALVGGYVAGSGAFGGSVCDGVGGGLIEGGEDHVVAGTAR